MPLREFHIEVQLGVRGSNEICVEHASEVHDAHEVTLITNKVN